MNRLITLSLIATTFAALLPMGAAAQTVTTQTVASASAQCILAGRLDADQRWAPQARGVELLDGAGKRVSGASKELLATVKAVRLSQPALLSNCSGNQALPEGDASSGKKSPAPAVSAGNAPIPVQAVAYPPLRVGGSLVELEVQAPAARVIALTRR